IGKMYVPAQILSKPSKLNDLEYSMVKIHSEAGYNILKSIDFEGDVAEIVYQHHEKMDGSGYPRQLKGKQILKAARILCVADVVEAMMSHRPYRSALGLTAALEEIERGAGTIYDTDSVNICVKLFRDEGYEI
ncbi:MAG TPA: HD domain-containing phosphohydrolase, partial [Anaerovoracaceae bacterium]|nr:HD domain-containing phosphohydrolase [Anaerovoracaceae bacterium]